MFIAKKTNGGFCNNLKHATEEIKETPKSFVNYCIYSIVLFSTRVGIHL